MDQNKLRIAHKLFYNLLNPSSLERRNVKFMLAATDPSTVAALRYIAANYPEDYYSWNDTALFLEFIK